MRPVHPYKMISRYWALDWGGRYGRREFYLGDKLELTAGVTAGTARYMTRHTNRQVVLPIGSVVADTIDDATDIFPGVRL